MEEIVYSRIISLIFFYIVQTYVRDVSTNERL